MHSLGARVTSLRKLLLCIRPGECHVVIWLSPIEVARLGSVPIFNVKSARITHIPIVVYLHGVGCVRRGRPSESPVPATLGHIIRERRAPPSLLVRAATSVATSSAATYATIESSGITARKAARCITGGVSATVVSDVCRLRHLRGTFPSFG